MRGINDWDFWVSHLRQQRSPKFQDRLSRGDPKMPSHLFHAFWGNLLNFLKSVFGFPLKTTLMLLGKKSNWIELNWIDVRRECFPNLSPSIFIICEPNQHRCIALAEIYRTTPRGWSWCFSFDSWKLKRVGRGCTNGGFLHFWTSKRGDESTYPHTAA